MNLYKEMYNVLYVLEWYYCNWINKKSSNFWKIDSL